jgi:hypothetical protein
MANFALRIWLLALALSGCDARRDAAAQSAITVKLPAARPAEPAPGFSFEDSKAEPAARQEPQSPSMASATL